MTHYRLVPTAEVQQYELEGWAVAGRDLRYPGHVWMSREAPDCVAAGEGSE